MLWLYLLEPRSYATWLKRVAQGRPLRLTPLSPKAKPGL